MTIAWTPTPENYRRRTNGAIAARPSADLTSPRHLDDVLNPDGFTPSFGIADLAP